jgi:hypothetical protein
LTHYCWPNPATDLIIFSIQSGVWCFEGRQEWWRVRPCLQIGVRRGDQLIRKFFHFNEMARNESVGNQRTQRELAEQRIGNQNGRSAKTD